MTQLTNSPASSSHHQYGENMAIDNDLVRHAVDAVSHPVVADLNEKRTAPDEPTLFDYEQSIEDISSLNHSTFDNGVYINFALTMLETCADDLLKEILVLEDPNSTQEQIDQAKFNAGVARFWLTNCEAPFTFEDCANLIENELIIQSFGQIDVPEVGKRSDELAQWILSDPYRAKSVLSAYVKIFTVASDFEDDLAHIIDEHMANKKPVRYTPRQRAG